MVGGVVGGIVGLALLGGSVFLILRRRRRQQERVMYDARVEPNPEISNSSAIGRMHEYRSSPAQHAIPQFIPAPNRREYGHRLTTEKASGAAAEYIGVSEVGSGATGSNSWSGAGSHGSSSASRTLLARQAMMNDELRGEVDNLRRDLERMREERAVETFGEGAIGSSFSVPPPQYSEPPNSDTS